MENLKELLKFIKIDNEFLSAINSKNIENIYQLLHKQYYLNIEVIKFITNDFGNKKVTDYFIPKSFEKELNSYYGKNEFNELMSKYIYILSNDNIKNSTKEKICESLSSLNKSESNEIFSYYINNELKNGLKFEESNYHLFLYGLNDTTIIKTKYIEKIVTDILSLYKTKLNDLLINKEKSDDKYDFKDKNYSFIKKSISIFNILIPYINNQKLFEQYYNTIKDFYKAELKEENAYGRNYIFTIKDIIKLIEKVILSNDVFIGEKYLKETFGSKKDFLPVIEDKLFVKIKEDRSYNNGNISDVSSIKVLLLNSFINFPYFFDTNYGKIYKERMFEDMKKNIELLSNGQNIVKELENISYKEKDGYKRNLEFYNTNKEEVFNIFKLMIEKNVLINEISKDKPESILNEMNKVVSCMIHIKYDSQDDFNIFINKMFYGFYIENQNLFVKGMINDNLIANLLSMDFYFNRSKKTNERKEFYSDIFNLLEETRIIDFKNRLFKRVNNYVEEFEFIKYISLKSEYFDIFEKESLLKEQKYYRLTVGRDLLSHFHFYFDLLSSEELFEYMIKKLNNGFFKSTTLSGGMYKKEVKYVDLSKEDKNKILEIVYNLIVMKKDDNYVNSCVKIFSLIEERKVKIELIKSSEIEILEELKVKVNNENIDVLLKKELIELIELNITEKTKKETFYLENKTFEISNSTREKAILDLINILTQK